MSDDNDKKDLPARSGVRRSPTQKRFGRLMGMKCFPEVKRRIKEGYPLADIACYVQKERGEYGDVKRVSLEVTLGEYRTSLSPAELVANTIPKAALKAEEKLAKGIDELAELEALFRQQKKRLDAFEKQQTTMGLHLPSRAHVAEMEIAMHLLTRMLDKKMDLGLLKRNLGSLNLMESKAAEAARGKFGADVADHLKDPDTRQKIISIVERLRRIKEMEENAQAAEGGDPE